MTLPGLKGCVRGLIVNDQPWRLQELARIMQSMLSVASSCILYAKGYRDLTNVHSLCTHKIKFKVVLLGFKFVQRHFLKCDTMHVILHHLWVELTNMHLLKYSWWHDGNELNTVVSYTSKLFGQFCEITSDEQACILFLCGAKINCMLWTSNMLKWAPCSWLLWCL